MLGSGRVCGSLVGWLAIKSYLDGYRRRERKELERSMGTDAWYIHGPEAKKLRSTKSTKSINGSDTHFRGPCRAFHWSLFPSGQTTLA